MQDVNSITIVVEIQIKPKWNPTNDKVFTFAKRKGTGRSLNFLLMAKDGIATDLLNFKRGDIIKISGDLFGADIRGNDGVGINVTSILESQLNTKE